MSATEKEIDHEYTREIVCPHCGHEHGDSWERGDEETTKCHDCGKSFSYYRYVEVIYVSRKLTDAPATGGEGV